MRRTKIKVEEGGMNMTPMIDIVFQMIIFFVCTAELDRKAFDEKIVLAMAPHGPAVEKRDPRTVTIEVDKKGRIQIGRIFMSLPVLQSMMRKAVSDYGQTVPVVIRGARETKHEDIKRIMDVCAGAGLWKIKFAAVKERAESVQ